MVFFLFGTLFPTALGLPASMAASLRGHLLSLHKMTTTKMHGTGTRTMQAVECQSSSFLHRAEVT
jgi:hypothetical protein